MKLDQFLKFSTHDLTDKGKSQEELVKDSVIRLNEQAQDRLKSLLFKNVHKVFK